MSAPLYTVDMLRLAASVSDYPRLAAPEGTSERRSATCGSRVAIDVVTDAQGRVTAVGAEVRACALGQASVAVLAQHVSGRTAAEISRAAIALKAYLEGSRDDAGGWPGLEIFAPARAHRARHPSILLAFDAAAEAAQAATGARVPA